MSFVGILPARRVTAQAFEPIAGNGAADRAGADVDTAGRWAMLRRVEAHQGHRGRAVQNGGVSWGHLGQDKACEAKTSRGGAIRRSQRQTAMRQESSEERGPAVAYRLSATATAPFRRGSAAPLRRPVARSSRMACMPPTLMV
jgi:hypothetical protein